ncbi:MAG: RIP metalloprotease RseP [Pikeienuella sp.]
MSTIASVPYIGWILPFLLVLGIVVFIHEYGHYIVGRWCGIRAEVFSIGFGKELYHWIDKRGMRWRIGMLPLGGYVKFAGDMDAASAGADRDAMNQMSAEELKGTFHTAAVWRRALTVLAGPVANFILSIAVFSAIAMWDGRGVNEPIIGAVRADANADIGLQAGDKVISVNGTFVDSYSSLLAELAAVDGQRVKAVVNRGRGEEEIDIHYLRPARIDAVLPGGAAADAGVEKGDVITALNGIEAPNFNVLRDLIVAAGAEPVELTIQRGDDILNLTLTPRMVDDYDAEGNRIKRPLIGVQNSSFGGIEPMREAASPLDALDYGVARTWSIIAATFAFIGDAFAGEADIKQLGGPIQIATVSGQAAEQGGGSLLVMIALISTSIGLLNLFPIPVLDGGHLVLYAYEAIRGRPAKERVTEYLNLFGLSLIVLLMVFATYNDIQRWWLLG